QVHAHASARRQPLRTIAATARTAAALPIDAALPGRAADRPTADLARRTALIVAALASRRAARQGAQALAAVQPVVLGGLVQATLLRHPVSQTPLIHSLGGAGGEGIG